jgi:hypothetical protein
MSANTVEAVVGDAVADFGRAASKRLAGPGQPEDQLRPPLVTLLELVGSALGVDVAPYGETPLPDLSVRPDYAISVDGVICGYVEVKAPGKGADPTRFKARSHDRKQWQALSQLPNILYTDGQETFSRMPTHRQRLRSRRWWRDLLARSWP